MWLTNLLASFGFFLISLFGGTLPATYVPFESSLISTTTSVIHPKLFPHKQLIRHTKSLGCLDYYKDEQNVYIANCVPGEADGLCMSGSERIILPDADPKTFRVLNESDGMNFPDCNYGADATSVYSENVRLKGINPIDFRGLGVDGLMKDNSFVYFKGVIDKDYPNPGNSKVHYDTQKFTPLIGKDTRALMLNNSGYDFYLLDNTYVYFFVGLYDGGVGYQYKLVEGADPSTFRLVSDKNILSDKADAYDSKNRYSQGEIIK
jgi:DKNYY family